MVRFVCDLGCNILKTFLDAVASNFFINLVGLIIEKKLCLILSCDSAVS